MMTKQISQFNQFDQASGCLFLLSWTLPWQLPEAYCIDDMARPANIQLQTVIEQLVEQGTISAQKFPNILYCDYMEAQYNIVDICMYLNTLTT
jgi:hypothetical protein